MKRRERYAAEIRELAEAEGDLAARQVIQPWTHAIIAVVCAVVVWVIPAQDARAVAFASVLYLPLFAAVVAVPLGRIVWTYRLPENASPDPHADAHTNANTDTDTDTDTDTGVAGSDAVKEAGPRVHMWGVGISIALAGGLGAVVTALVPVSWIRWLLPVMGVWAVLETVRRDRGRYRRAREAVRAAAATPWFDDYHAVIRERRERVRGSGRRS
ncbi:hypothetical protein AB0O01_01270 [Streptomyces sp. NPDC093252]|uniref:hypothetical protein n=1 Tax=Streptomyces sp. NPDC093252 TaxID=3154980 RepID=UPI003435DBA9